MDFVRYFYPHIYDEIMTGLIFFYLQEHKKMAQFFSCFLRFRKSDRFHGPSKIFFQVEWEC